MTTPNLIDPEYGQPTREGFQLIEILARYVPNDRNGKAYLMQVHKLKLLTPAQFFQRNPDAGASLYEFFEQYSLNEDVKDVYTRQDLFPSSARQKASDKYYDAMAALLQKYQDDVAAIRREYESAIGDADKGLGTTVVGGYKQAARESEEGTAIPEYTESGRGTLKRLYG